MLIWCLNGRKYGGVWGGGVGGVGGVGGDGGWWRVMGVENDGCGCINAGSMVGLTSVR